MSAQPGTIVDPTGAIWALRCACGAHPTQGHRARPIGQTDPPVITEQPAPKSGLPRHPAAKQENLPKPYYGRVTGTRTTRQRRRYRPRAAAFVDLAAREGVTDGGHRFKLLSGSDAAVGYALRSIPEEVERVYVLGARPGGGTLDGFYEWAGGIGRKWREAAAGHFTENPELPVCRYELPGEDGPTRKLEIHRAKSWFGDGAATPADAAAAMAIVATMLAAAFDGATVLATPATTGRDLFLRTIPRDVAWPVLDDDTAELVRSTTGQGRIEMFDHDGELPALAELDGRFMYGALCWGLGVGPTEHTTARGNELTEHVFGSRNELYRPARYRVCATVPKGWDRPGLFGVMGDGREWHYPRRPGESLTTWVDGSELFVAVNAGWSVRVVERLAFDKPARGPLDTWARKLCALWRDVYPEDDTPEGPRKLARTALRSMLLHSLGAFVGRSHVVTRSVPVTEGNTVPADALNLREEAGRFWFGVRKPPAWPEMVHPEWSAQVWGRCRARMMSGPMATGALHADPGTVLAIRTDALYLTRDPGWPDDGKVGRLRLKSFTPGPLPAPRSVVELLRLRNG